MAKLKAKVKAKSKAARKPAKKKVQPIPERYRNATPYLCVKGAAAAIDFYKRGFGAKEVYRIEAPPGVVGHAELKVGNALFMLSDEYDQMSAKSPLVYGGSPVGISLYVKNADTFVAQAVSAGAKVVRAVEDQFYGDRAGKIEDPFGHVWMVATHKEDVTPKEMRRRATALFSGAAGQPG